MPESPKGIILPFNVEHPLDFASQRVTPIEAVGFVRGTHAVYNLVEAINPDLLILPERGAGPIGWALDQFKDIYRGRDRFKVHLPIGTCTDAATGRMWGLEKHMKREAVRVMARNIQKAKGWVERPLLIDEVQSGATLTNVTHNLLEAFTTTDPERDLIQVSDKLYVVAVQDSRNEWLTRRKAKGYKTIAYNAKPNVPAFIQEVPLFTVDRQVLLNYLLFTEDITLENFSLPTLMRNTQAEKLIRNLIRVVEDPEIIEKDMDRLLQMDGDKADSPKLNPDLLIDWYSEIAKVASNM